MKKGSAPFAPRTYLRGQRPFSVIPTEAADIILPFAPRERRLCSGGTVATSDPPHPARRNPRNLREIKRKIKNLGAPTFLGRGYPSVFAYVGERKELWGDNHA